MLDADAVITLGAGNYRLQAPLGGSAYGLVWRADGPCGAVALKLVNQTQMARATPALQERWSASAAKEISFLRSLAPWDERHIVRLLDSGSHDGLPVMALELMDGDLARRIAAPVPPAQAIGWLGQVNQALAKVHQYGWVYLDLKPANLLTTRAGAIKLADFGTSRLRRDAAPACYAGTASWQAPEQFFPASDGSYRTDPRSDYFALGALFYYLVSGGLQLRFCSDCGHAYRAEPASGAAPLLASPGGRIPPTLHADEAAQFRRRIGDAALALLRALLDPDRHARPAHAIQISRMLAGCSA